MMDNVMVDIETLGTRCGCNILSIGAVLFNIKENKIGKTFYSVIYAPSFEKYDFHIVPDTVKWWGEQEKEARSILRETLDPKKSKPIEEVLENFTKFLFDNGENFKVWGCGPDLDNVVMFEAYRQVGIPAPWVYWNNRCYRTVKELDKEFGDKVPMNREGTYHNALDDAISQAKHLLEILK